MKKSIFLLIFALLLSLFANTSCAKETEAYVGMSYDEFRELVPHEEQVYSYIGRYLFYYDNDGQPIVVQMDFKDTKVEEVVVLPDGKPSLRKIKKLKQDMTPMEAFELLGMPSGTAGFGIQYILYETKSGEHVRITWQGNGDGKTIVLSWDVYEPNE